MSSELSTYIENIISTKFNTSNSFKIFLFILSNISYSIINNLSYKSMYFEGDINSILHFISILKNITEVKTYKEFLKNNYNVSIIIFEELNNIENDINYFNKSYEYEKYCKIFINKINKVNYLTNNDSVIFFKKSIYPLESFNIENIIKEFIHLKVNFINSCLRTNKFDYIYEESVLGENYNLLLYDKYLLNRINYGLSSFMLDGTYFDIKYYKGFKNTTLNTIKEYLLLLFGKPGKANEWYNVNSNSIKHLKCL